MKNLFSNVLQLSELRLATPSSIATDMALPPISAPSSMAVILPLTADQETADRPRVWATQTTDQNPMTISSAFVETTDTAFYEQAPSKDGSVSGSAFAWNTGSGNNVSTTDMTNLRPCLDSIDDSSSLRYPPIHFNFDILDQTPEHSQPLQRQNFSCFPRHSGSTVIQPLRGILFSIKSTVCQVLSYNKTVILWTPLGTGRTKAPQFRLARCSGIGHYHVPVCIWQNNKSTGLDIHWFLKKQTIQQVTAAMWLATPSSIQWMFAQSSWDSRIHCCVRIPAGESGMNLCSPSWPTNDLLIEWLPRCNVSMSHRFVYLQAGMA